MTTTLILFAHGARDPAWSLPLQKLQNVLARRCPTHSVRLAFLELMEPALPDSIATAVASGSRRIVVIPAFMARGAHLRRDLPALLGEARRLYPEVEIVSTEALGEADAVMAAMAEWVAVTVAAEEEGDASKPAGRTAPQSD